MHIKKEIVFVIPGLAAGGAEKSLVNLLNTIDYSRYNVDLIVFNKSGIFLSMLPPELNLIEIKGSYVYFCQNLIASVFHFLKHFQWHLAYHRLAFFCKNKFIKNKAFAEQKAWKNSSAAIPVLTKKYDAAIGFLEKTSIYYVIDKINAKTKLGWVHTNYASSGMNANFDKHYYSKLNHVITISNECKESLIAFFPNLAKKIVLIYNIVSPKIIINLAEDGIQESQFNYNNKFILTIARLSKEKGIDIAINACFEIVKDIPDIKWVVIGDGNQKAYLEQLVIEKKMQNNFIFIGLKQNPYPYLKHASVYVQPSRYEGKSIAIDEAKILQKPIVVTNFTTAKDQIMHEVTGIISTMNPSQLAKDIQIILKDNLIANNLKLNLSKENYGTEYEIETLYNLIN